MAKDGLAETRRAVHALRADTAGLDEELATLVNTHRSRHHASISFRVDAQALLAALRARLPAYHAAAPDTIQRRFLETPGQIITTGNVITVRLERRAYSPVLRKADLPPPPPFPGGGNRTLHYEFT